MKDFVRKFWVAPMLMSLVIFSGQKLTLTGQTPGKSDPESKLEKKQSNEDQIKKAQEEQKIVLHNEIVVTATRTERALATVPKPVSVVNWQKILERAPNNMSELLPELPGTDIVGVGANQSRPVIRGLRGQRILLLTDGLRLSNSRRSQSFGEIPALVETSHMERVEIIRGPASVLYGSEAIGGVINMITRAPSYSQEGTHISGSLGYRASSADSQNKGTAELLGNVGRLGFLVSGSYRKSQDYLAPAGSFGNITLDKQTPVNDTGVQDNNLNVLLGYRIGDNNNLSLKYENYQAKDAGFGYVAPGEYSLGDPTIRLFYPDQDMRRFTLKYENRSLHSAVADGLTVTGYQLENSRTFESEITIPFFPGAGLNVISRNFTDINTLGGRVELTKVLWKSHILTYGADFYSDDSKNTDSEITSMFGFGPPIISEDNSPNVPNATLRSFGLFLQDDISLFKRSSLVLGARYQNVRAKTQETPGWAGMTMDSTDSTMVAAANFLYGLSDSLKLIVSLGRGFRSPNLPERFFEGATPDGGGYQISNTGLKAETSFNIDLGARFHTERFYAEASVFRNLVNDGIQLTLTGNTIGRLPEYQNVNIDQLRLQGVELLGQYRFDFGVTVTANYSHIASKNLTNPELMFADTYGSRWNVTARYNFPGNLFWAEYHVRRNGNQKDVNLVANPIGDILPGFTVHSLRAGITLFRKTAFPQSIGIIVNNLTDILYSEFSNSSFFRPAPGRHIVMTWTARF